MENEYILTIFYERRMRYWQIILKKIEQYAFSMRICLYGTFRFTLKTIIFKIRFFKLTLYLPSN